MTRPPVPGPESFAPAPEPELFRPVALAQIGLAGTAREVAATPGECEAIAARLRIPAVASLFCHYRLTAVGGGVVVAEGALAAHVTQECIVSAEPFGVDLSETFRVRFVPEEQFDDSEDTPIDLDADDELPYRGAHLDLGEATVEQLALALDPYPRAPGVEAAPEAQAGAGEPTDERQPSPFAALARRRQEG
jgi:uncharacterized metal-binding protein YceD (DUF177 family)